MIRIQECIELNVYMAFDNLPIKAYVYPYEEVKKVHNLSNMIPTVGGRAAVCPEDGYTLFDITGEYKRLYQMRNPGNYR